MKQILQNNLDSLQKEYYELNKNQTAAYNNVYEHFRQKIVHGTELGLLPNAIVEVSAEMGWRDDGKMSQTRFRFFHKRPSGTEGHFYKDEIIEAGINYQNKLFIKHSSNEYLLESEAQMDALRVMSIATNWAVDNLVSMSEELGKEYTEIYMRDKVRSSELSRNINEVQRAINVIEEQEKLTALNAKLNSKKRVDALPEYNIKTTYGEDEISAIGRSIVEEKHTESFPYAYNQRTHISAYRIDGSTGSGKSFNVTGWYPLSDDKEREVKFDKVRRENVIGLIQNFENWNTKGTVNSKKDAEERLDRINKTTKA